MHASLSIEYLSITKYDLFTKNGYVISPSANSTLHVGIQHTVTLANDGRMVMVH